MGLSEEDQKKAQEQRVIANGGGDMDRSLIDSSALTDEIYSHPDGTQVEDAGCCQANGSSTCCRSPKLPENPASFNLDTKEKRKGSKNQISINIGKGGAESNKVCTMPTWLETWESEDVYAALALIGAAVSVAVAYNCYRQLG